MEQVANTVKGMLEKKETASGTMIIGVDEVGRGCIAGPVVTAAVCLDYEKLWELPEKTLKLIRDSKTLSHKQRQEILPTIQDCSQTNAVAYASSSEVDQLGIVEATFTAMRRAIEKLKITDSNALILVDGRQKISHLANRQEAVIKGDSSVFAIAAASILAKESRDHYMTQLHDTYPQYRFDRHVGYGTKVHLEMIEEYGVCDAHRQSFAPVKRALEASI